MQKVKADYTYTFDQGILGIDIITSKIIRVRFTRNSDFYSRNSLSILSQSPCNDKISTEKTDKNHILHTSDIRILIDRISSKIMIQDNSGHIFLQEGDRTLKSTSILGEDVYTVRQDFVWKEEEGLFGLGQFQDGIMNWRKHRVEFMQKNTVAINPMLVSSEKYAILWNNYSFSRFVDNAKESYFWSEVADEIDYFFIYGRSIDEVISGYRTLTGKSPMLPKCAFGYIQSKERYKSQEEILAVVKKYRNLEIPLDIIVQDWRYWTGSQWGQKSFDPTRFPNPKAMIKELHEIWNVHIMISIWPKMDPSCSDFIEMNKNPKFFYKNSPNKRPFYDAFNEEARKIYWDQANRGLFSKGIDAWWTDATEPEVDLFFNTFHVFPRIALRRFKKRMQPAIGTGARYLNTYSLMQAKGIYENQRKTTDEKRVMNLTRSAFLGQQRYSAITWSGDIRASWEVLKKQIPAGLNFCLSGIPYWTQDIGGFFVFPHDFPGGCENEKYRELYTRWFQLGAFNPLFRSHGTNTPREVWHFGQPGTEYYDALTKSIRLRYRLLPYIYSLAGKTTLNDYTIMRGLVFDFPNDSKVYGIADQFMFGPNLMVCPVTSPRVKNRTIYLPFFENTNRSWYDFWTGKQYKTSQTIGVNVTIDKIPIFVPSGSILPLGPDIQYATQSHDPIELRIYGGNDGEFEIYEDENDGYNYEKSIFSIIRIEWKDDQKLLKIYPRKGEYPNMLQNRTFNLSLINENTALEDTDKISHILTLDYSGQTVEKKINVN